MRIDLRLGSLTFLAAATLLFAAPEPAAAQQQSDSAANAASANAAAASSQPARLPDGHPDFNGFWANGTGPDTPVRSSFGFRDPQIKRGGDQSAKVQAADPNQPPYKPELVAKVKELARTESKSDPAFFCKPGGVPRVGPPHGIIQAPGMPIVFLYEVVSGNTFRVITTDGRAHDPDADDSYYGDSVGHWEGDTLVVDTVGFNDDTWLGLFGWFHSKKLHVIEKITREGDLLRYQATVEDPEVFTKPWVMNPWISKLDNKELPLENAPCMDQDIDHITTLDEKTRVQ